MHMNGRQFAIFVCDLMLCLAFFSIFMARKPTADAWETVGFAAVLVIVFIIFYFLWNEIAKGFAEFLKAFSE